MEKDPGEGTSRLSEILKDSRFAHLVNDPRFKQLSSHGRKVKIDKRFESMFNDSKFKIKYTVDKYGRKLNRTSSEDLKKYYDIDSTDEEEEEAERREEEKQISKIDSDEDENDQLDNDGEIISDDIKEKLTSTKLDYARGEGRLLTDSSSDEESSEDEEVFIEHVWGELDNDASRTDESTNRLAACNMNWDRIRASDIMVLCNSFLPRGGSILSVKIYPSEFGKERMKKEELHGPPELIEDNEKMSNDDDDDDDDLVKEQDSDVEEGDEYHMEKLRQYQLNRLKYFYAVIECDSVNTADKLYKECDGLEYESTATKLDLRFIPDDVTFDEDEPKDVCTELPDLNKYTPRLFTTTALQQAKVELTWDETNIERKELNEKLSTGKINDISAADLQKYVAYSSDDEEEEEEDSASACEDKKGNEASDLETTDLEVEEEKQTKWKKSKDTISKYKSLLEEINKKEEEKHKSKFEIELTWDINVEEKSEINKDKNKKDMTPIEKILEKKREKNKKRKEERRKKKKGGDENDSSSDELPDAIDMNDPYFAEEFANSDFKPPKNSKLEKSKKKFSSTCKGTNEENSDEDEVVEKKTKELELLLEDKDDSKHHFSLKKIQDAETDSKTKKKRNKKLKKSKQEIDAKKAEVEDNFKINVDDDRFKALYTSHLFNIDPSDPHFKKTKAMDQFIEEKLKRRYENKTAEHAKIENDEPNPKRPKEKIENSLLIKSIKRKIKGKYF